MDATDDKATCIRSLNLMATGDVDQFAEVYGPDAYNREAKDEPPATRGKGPEALYATALGCERPTPTSDGTCTTPCRTASWSCCTQP